MRTIWYFIRQLHVFSGKKLYINLVAMLIISLLEGVGIVLLIPMIGMTGLVEMDTGGTPLTGLFETFQLIPAAYGLPIILSIYVVIAVGQNVLQRSIMVKNAAIQHCYFRHLRMETYHSLLHANWDFFIKRRSSDLIHLMTGEISRVGTGAYAILQFMSSFIFTLIQIGLALWLAPGITLMVLCFGLVLLFFNRIFLKRSLALGAYNFELGKDYLGGLTDQINGMKDIKSNTLEASRAAWYEDITAKMRDQQVHYTRLKTMSQMYYKIASSLLIAAFIFIAVTVFQAQGMQLILIIIIFSRLWPSVTGIQHHLEQIASTLPSFQAVRNLQQESRLAREFQRTDSDVDKRLTMQQELICHGVSFRYNKQEERYALKDIHFSIPANQMTAIVGRSGAGKSTLIDLLMGLNHPESGAILVDGNRLTNDALPAWRRSISYVPQEPFLFHASVRENMLLVAPQATEEELWEALAFSSAADFVKQLPQGLDTRIGDRGIKLSGGERQRLVLARAILRKPAMLVLDEATSALDTENEAHIQEALEKLHGKMTVLVIAHRLSTIRNADQVIVLDEGKLMQAGGFNQLKHEKKGIFQTLLQSQLEVGNN